jgi:hypothetical protein
MPIATNIAAIAIVTYPASKVRGIPGQEGRNVPRNRYRYYRHDDHDENSFLGHVHLSDQFVGDAENVAARYSVFGFNVLYVAVLALAINLAVTVILSAVIPSRMSVQKSMPVFQPTG